MLMLKLLVSSSLGALLLSLSLPLTVWLLLLSGCMTSHVDPPPSCSCSMSCNCGPPPLSSPLRISLSPRLTSVSLCPRSLRPRSRLGFGFLVGGGGGKRDGNLTVLRGSVVSDVGSGRDSMSVSFSSGMVVRREAGRSTGEHATIVCRRCVLEAKNDKFSVSR
jgi:hypothetical protein